MKFNHDDRSDELMFKSQAILYSLHHQYQENHKVFGKLLGFPVAVASITIGTIGQVSSIMESLFKGSINLACFPFSKNDSSSGKRFKASTGAKQIGKSLLKTAVLTTLIPISSFIAGISTPLGILIKKDFSKNTSKAMVELASRFISNK